MDKIRILVIEDSPDNLEEAEETLKDVINNSRLEVRYTTTLKKAIEQIQGGIEGPYDGVLSDIFFPYEGGDEPELYGTRVGEMLLKKGVPVFLITSTHHHGQRTEPASTWARSKGMELFDVPSEGLIRDLNGKVKPIGWKKCWADAFFQLIKLIIGKERNFYLITEEGIKDLFGDGKQELWGLNWNYDKTLEYYRWQGKRDEWIAMQINQADSSERAKFHAEMVKNFVRNK